MCARSWLALALLLGGCVPSFDPFTVVEPGEDAGSRVDAGGAGERDGGPDAPRDAGPGGSEDAGPRRDAGGGAGTVLSQVASCDDVVRDAFLREEWDDDASDFRNLGGAFAVEGGALIIRGGSDDLSAVQTPDFLNDAVSCADARLPAATPGEALHTFGHSVRGFEHGMTCFVDVLDGEVRLFGLEPAGNALLDVARPTWLGDPVSLRMLAYLSGDAAYCEVQNLDTAEVLSLRGTYRGETRPYGVALQGMAGGDIRVDRVVSGPPAPAIADRLPP